MEFVRIKSEDVSVGIPLPWSVYCIEKALLLQEGTLISSERQRQVILQRGVYRNLTQQEIQIREEQRANSVSKEEPAPEINPFSFKEGWARILSDLLPSIANGTASEVPEKIIPITTEIQLACECQADAVLAAIHLSRHFSYTAVHPIHTAILCELLGKRINTPEQERTKILAAALTMNVGMQSLQETLFEQKTPLTDKQKQGIVNHPAKSVSLLRSSGVTDSIWLQAILQHHERINATGYPDQLSGDKICEPAKIIALADMYAALVTPRVHRKPIVAQEALKAVFNKRGQEVDETLANQLIREVGVFPPGSVVRLANGEIAVVTRRAIVKKKRDSTAPMVHSILSPRGGLYDEPIKRDCSNVLFKISEAAPTALPDSVEPLTIWHF